MNVAILVLITQGIDATPSILAEFRDSTCVSSSPLDTQLATAGALETPDALRIIRALDDGPIRHHRKQWEFVYIIRALEHLGMLAPGKRALVFAAGKEPLISYLASKGVHVIATDMDTSAAQESGWVYTNQHSSSKDNLFRPSILREADFARLVDFQFMDMNAINASMYGTFDVVWSTCSLEHVGSIAEGKLFALKSTRLLKPGGVAVHTTEFTLSSRDRTVWRGPTVLWRRDDVEELRADMTAFGLNVSGICLASGTTALDKYVDLPPYRSHKHMRLRLGYHVATSVAWTARRP